jgi:hypothetical protein
MLYPSKIHTVTGCLKSEREWGAETAIIRMKVVELPGRPEKLYACKSTVRNAEFESTDQGLALEISCWLTKVTSSLRTAWIIVMCPDLLGSETSYDK